MHCNCLYCKDSLNSENIMQIIDCDNNYIFICKDCFFNIFNTEIHCSKCNKNITYTQDLDENKIHCIHIKNSKILKYGILCEDCNSLINNDEYEVTGFSFASNNFREYSYKPNPKFKKLKNEDKNNIYLGVELEVGCLSSSEKVNRFCNEHAGSIFYFKRDASIRNYGCEIVTHPCTLAFHKSIYSNWEILCRDLKNVGFKSGTEANTGIHIHVNRSCLQNDQIKKMDLFVNHYQTLFEKISGRSNNHYARYNGKNIRSWGHSTESRYSSVNFENFSTVEFRIFNGSIKKQIIFANLELIHAIVNFTSSVKYEDLYENKEKIIKDFKNFVKNNNNYINLNALIESLNI